MVDPSFNLCFNPQLHINRQSKSYDTEMQCAKLATHFTELLMNRCETFDFFNINGANEQKYNSCFITLFIES